MRTPSTRAALALLAALGCSPTAEEPVSAGGQAPEPRASLQGTLTYSGPPPSCDADGEVKGLALLSLFEQANPPPPQGAGLPVSLLLVPGDALFRAPDDCRRPGDARTLARSAAFTWPAISLDPPRGTGPAAYRVLGTWDDDRNMNPLYTVRASPTRGDVVGGALEGPLDAPTLASIQVGPSSRYPEGQVLRGVTVTLAVPVTTELPVARLRPGTRPLSSEAAFPLAFDRQAMEAGLLERTPAGLQLPDLTEPRYAQALQAAGLDLSPDPVARAWYVEPLDLDGDGAPDPHPVLGALAAIPRLSPVVAFQRARTVAEQAAGVPSVLILAHPVADVAVKARDLDLAVAPLAVVQLDPEDPACAVPYAAPGNVTLLYESAGAVCTELPTGRYDVNVVHGLAGARAIPTSTATSETGAALLGGQPSGQFWVIPNELGPPDTRYDPLSRNQLDPPGAATTLTLAEQGDEGRFVVTDPDPSDDRASERAACKQAYDPVANTTRAIRFVPVDAPCCARVRHLCGLPLCPSRDLGDGLGAIRELERLGEDGKATCMPFELPPSCCP